MHQNKLFVVGILQGHSVVCSSVQYEHQLGKEQRIALSLRKDHAPGSWVEGRVVTVELKPGIGARRWPVSGERVQLAGAGADAVALLPRANVPPIYAGPEMGVAR